MSNSLKVCSYFEDRKCDVHLYIHVTQCCGVAAECITTGCNVFRNKLRYLLSPFPLRVVCLCVSLPVGHWSGDVFEYLFLFNGLVEDLVKPGQDRKHVSLMNPNSQNTAGHRRAESAQTDEASLYFPPRVRSTQET